MRKSLYVVTHKQIATINRDRAVSLYKALQQTRHAYAMAIGASKKLGDVGSHHTHQLHDFVNHLKSEYKRETQKRTHSLIVRRQYKGRTIEEHLRDYEDRADLLRSFRVKIKRDRERARTNYDSIFNRKPCDLLKQFHRRRLDTPKRPTDGDQYIGLEIECITPNDADLTVLSPFSKWVNIGADGSIDYGQGEKGVEIRICVKRNETRDVVPGILDALKSIGARVNKSCGLHVHLDQRNNEETALAFQKLVRSLNLLYSVVPASRRKNRYCKRNRHADFASAVNGDRYYAINATAYRRYKTLEVRLFGGTLDADKIINWIETLHAIAYGAIVLRCPSNFDTARKYWKLSDANVTWLKARQLRFAQLNALAPIAESDTENINDNTLDNTADACGVNPALQGSNVVIASTGVAARRLDYSQINDHATLQPGGVVTVDSIRAAVNELRGATTFDNTLPVSNETLHELQEG